MPDEDARYLKRRARVLRDDAGLARPRADGCQSGRSSDVPPTGAVVSTMGMSNSFVSLARAPTAFPHPRDVVRLQRLDDARLEVGEGGRVADGSGGPFERRPAPRPTVTELCSHSFAGLSTADCAPTTPGLTLAFDETRGNL